MSNSLLFSLIALLALVPAALVPAGRAPQAHQAGGAVYWGLIAVAIAGPAAWIVVQVIGQWRTGVAAALWLTVMTSIVLFAAVAAVSPVARRLTPILLGYLFVLGVVATGWQNAPERPMALPVSPGWLVVHIVVSLAAYGLLTLAAVAGAAVFIQERAIKLRRPTVFTRRLPSAADGEMLQARLLMASFVVLAVALATGIGMEWVDHRMLLRLDHKTVFSLATFVLIGVLLFLHHRVGLGGRRVARVALLAYLLLTLAYPGVKFVTDVLMGPT
jgi:ABC-type uncharacterized transport system permease subunit